MIQPRYSNEELYKIAKKNYDTLNLFCDTLEREGYWNEPGDFLHEDIYTMLDMYIQSVLLNLTIYCGDNGYIQRKFISEVTQQNALGCTIEGDLPEKVVIAANKILRMPPILLQLCGLRDTEKKSFLSSLFVDALFNILISCSLLNNKQSKYVDRFFTDLYDKIGFFVNEDQKKYVVDARYIFLKVSTEKYYELKAPLEQLRQIRDKENEKEALRRKEEKALEKLQEIEKKEVETQKEEETNLKEQQPESDLEKVETAKIVEEKQGGEEQIINEDEAMEKELSFADPQKSVSEKSVESSFEDENTKEIIEKSNKKKEKSIFEYTDEELMQLQKKGKLKIHAPKIKQLQEESKQKALRKLEEEKVEQIKQEIDKINHAKKLQALLDELNGLIGLEEVKKEIQSLINLIKVKKMRESYQMPSMDVTYHMVFTGNPGTGKTTVARLVAQIYKELGILSEGHLVEVDRAGLVAGYVGQTAMKVKEVVERALGGVLFIDEAYALTNKSDANDFGGEAIDTLVKMMEDHRDNLVVIVAGYEKEMEEFLKANTGLISRFNKFVNFKDYTNEELLDILHMFTEKSGVQLEKDAQEEIASVLEHMSPEKKFLFGNGRGMRNTFETIMGKQANRIVLLDMPTEEELKIIKKEDVIDVIL